MAWHTILPALDLQSQYWVMFLRTVMYATLPGLKESITCFAACEKRRKLFSVPAGLDLSAPAGQVSTQHWQPAHFLSSISTPASVTWMALQGHTFSQARHFLHLSETCLGTMGLCIWFFDSSFTQPIPRFFIAPP